MLSFAQPWAFLALAAVALPVLAHMAFRRTTKRQLFPSLRFIRVSRIPRTSRKTPVDLLLLFLRILFFALLACLLADPRWVLPNTGDRGEETIILLDQSASMGGWGAWGEAQQEIDQVLKDSKGKVGFLGFASSPLAGSEVSPTRDYELVSKAFEQAEALPRQGNPQTAIDRVYKLFGAQATSKTLVLVTDLQRTNWQAVAQKLAERGVSLDLRVVGHAQAQGSNRPGNLTLANARTAPASPDELRIWAQVRNSSPHEVEADLVLETGGLERNRKKILIGANQAAQAQFVLPRGDFVTAAVRIESGEPDALAIDDRRELWLKAPPPRRFAFLADLPEHLPNEVKNKTAVEQRFLEAALASAGDGAWDRWILSQENADSLMEGGEDLALDVMLMPGSGLPSDEKRMGFLNNFLENGGVVVATPGERFVQTVTKLREVGWMNLRLKGVPGGARDRADPFRFAAFPPDTSLGKVFEGKPARDLELASLIKYGEITPLDDDLEVRVLSANDHPLVFERKIGKGRLVFFAFRLDMTWSDLPSRNSFLPLLVELVKGEGGIDRSWPRLEVGEGKAFGDRVFTAETLGANRFHDQFVEVVLPVSETSPEIFDHLDALGILGSGEVPRNPEGQASLPQEEGEPLWLWFAIGCAALFLIENIWVSPRRLEGPQQSDA